MLKFPFEVLMFVCKYVKWIFCERFILDGHTILFFFYQELHDTHIPISEKKKKISYGH